MNDMVFINHKTFLTLSILVLFGVGCDFVDSFKKEESAKEYDALLASQVRDTCGVRGYYQFVFGALKQNCASCHGGLGPGTGSFAAFDLATSYVQAKARVNFSDTDRSLLAMRSSNSGHCPACGSTWSQTLRESLADWALAESENESICQTLSEISDESFEFDSYTPPENVEVTIVPEGLAVFSRSGGLHTELQNACASCHVPGKVAAFAAFAQSDVSASYKAAKPRVNFYDVTASMLYQNASESNHGDGGCSTCGNTGFLTRLQADLLDWRDQEDLGSENLKVVLSDELIRLPTLDQTQTLDWDLSSIKADLSGAFFRIRVNRPSSNPEDYRVLDIRLINNSGKSIQVKNILPRVSGTEDRLLSTYTVVDEEVANGANVLLSDRPIWITYDPSTSTLGWTFEILR